MAKTMADLLSEIDAAAAAADAAGSELQRAHAAMADAARRLVESGAIPPPANAGDPIVFRVVRREFMVLPNASGVVERPDPPPQVESEVGEEAPADPGGR